MSMDKKLPSLIHKIIWSLYALFGLFNHLEQDIHLKWYKNIKYILNTYIIKFMDQLSLFAKLWLIAKLKLQPFPR